MRVGNKRGQLKLCSLRGGMSQDMIMIPDATVYESKLIILYITKEHREVVQNYWNIETNLNVFWTKNTILFSIIAKIGEISLYWIASINAWIYSCIVKPYLALPMCVLVYMGKSVLTFWVKWWIVYTHIQWMNISIDQEKISTLRKI